MREVAELDKEGAREGEEHRARPVDEAEGWVEDGREEGVESR